MFNLAVISHFLLHYKIINTISSLKNSRPEEHLFLRTSFFVEHLWLLFLFSVETVSSFVLIFFLNAFFQTV